jgi:hypothetical protein
MDENDSEKYWLLRVEPTEIVAVILPICVFSWTRTSAFTKLFSQAEIAMTATIRTLLRGSRSSTAIGIHAASSHFGKFRGLEYRKFGFSSRPRLRPRPLHRKGSSSLLTPQTPWNKPFISAKARSVRIARMLESFRQQAALHFGRILAKISRNSFSGDEESMKHSEWLEDFLAG